MSTFQAVPPPCNCGISGISGFDHSADCAVADWERNRPGPPIPAAFVMVTCGPDVLWGLRCGEHAAGIWGWPGGKADRPGNMAQNAVAELREETGLWFLPSTLVHIPHADEWIAENGQSHLCTYFRVNVTPAEKSRVRRMEPHKHACWRFFPAHQPPDDAFPTEIALMNAHFGL